MPFTATDEATQVGIRQAQPVEGYSLPEVGGYSDYSYEYLGYQNPAAGPGPSTVAPVMMVKQSSSSSKRQQNLENVKPKEVVGAPPGLTLDLSPPNSPPAIPKNGAED